jgi:disulfide bond formation protein DsbB
MTSLATARTSAMNQLYLVAATLNVWVVVLVLLAAFAAQFIAGEPPCPLCVMQRIALMLLAIGPLYILARAHAGKLSARDAAVGNGMAILAALLGVTASGRQVLLHILPGDPGFGSPVLGLHLYTWCLVTFGCQIAASAVLLLAASFLDDTPASWPWARPTAIALAVIVAANLLSVVAEAGFNWDLPENPVRYLLFG